MGAIAASSTVERSDAGHGEAGCGGTGPDWWSRNATVVVPVASVLSALLAWSVRFVQDDAYISYRYARNLADGVGLVFQAGDHVQGFTNPLWTVLLALPIRLGLDAVPASQAMGAAALGGTVAVSFHLARRLLGTWARAAAAVAVLVGTVSFTWYGTGGLETPLQTLLLTALALLAVRRLDGRDTPVPVLLGASTLAGLAMLTRLDSAVVALPWLAALSVEQVVPLDGPRGWRLDRRAVLPLVGPAAVLVGGWLDVADRLYGSPVPNTLVAKSSGFLNQRFGVTYLALFVLSYGLVVLVPGFWMRRREMWASVPWRVVLGVIALVCLYVLVVGGDFMEFRFMVPVLPLVACLVTWCLLAYRRRARTASIAVLAFCSLAHLGATSPTNQVSSFAELARQVDGTGADHPGWDQVGRRLGELFPGGSDAPGQVRIAVGPAGAIPYRSDLPTVDLLGLNDAWVAHHGIRVDDRPGHAVRAPVDYLLRRGVDLLIETPLYVAPGSRDRYTMADVATMSQGHLSRRDQLPDDARIVEIPITSGASLVTVQLSPDGRIDELVGAGRLKRFPIEG